MGALVRDENGQIASYLGYENDFSLSKFHGHTSDKEQRAFNLSLVSTGAQLVVES